MRMMHCGRAWRPLLGELFFSQILPFIAMLNNMAVRAEEDKEEKYSNVAQNGILWLLARRHYYSQTETNLLLDRADMKNMPLPCRKYNVFQNKMF